MYNQYKTTEFKLGNFYFSINTVYKTILCLLLLLPENVFSFITLYSSSTPGYINYKWLDYKFGLVQLIILIIGSLMLFKHKNKLIPSIFILFLIREIIISTYTQNNIFEKNAYEMYLAFFVGVAFVELVVCNCSSTEEIKNFFLLIVFLNVLTIFPRALFNLTGVEGRFNILNLDVGMTGTFCGIAFIISCFDKECKHRIFKMVVSLAGLFLSGSRVNLLIFALILFSGIIINMFRERSINRERWKRGNAIFIGLVIIGIAAYIYMNASGMWSRWIRSILNSRMLEIFNNTSMQSDSSFIGRSESISAGFDIIKTYPVGISGYFINLQTETRQRGFATFPHSSLMDAYILFGPIVICLIIYLVRNLIKLFQVSFPWFLVLLYMLTFITISGGPLVNFKIIFFYGMILYITSRIINEAKDSDYGQTDISST